MTKDMTQGSPLRLILAFAVPLMLGSLFQQFYNLADTIIAVSYTHLDVYKRQGNTKRKDPLSERQSPKGGPF